MDKEKLELRLTGKFVFDVEGKNSRIVIGKMISKKFTSENPIPPVNVNEFYNSVGELIMKDFNYNPKKYNLSSRLKKLYGQKVYLSSQEDPMTKALRSLVTE